MNALRRVLAVARKEFRQLRRDRLTGAMIIGIPLMQVLLFGYAINTDVRHLRAGVADLAGTQRARMLVADAEASQVIDVVERVQSAADLESLLQRGVIAVGLFIPHDFDRRVYRLGTAALHGEPAQVPAQLLVDGGDPVILGAAQGLAHLPVTMRFVAGPSGVVSHDSFEVRAFYNPERRSVVQIVPGLIGVILTMTMVLFTAVAIVRERERGNLELLITTPVRTIELMVGKILPYIAIGLIQVTLVLAIGVVVFGVPVRGSLLDLYLAAVLFVGASLTLGLLISTFAQTQFQAAQMMVFVFLPSMLLSGFMFPFDGMPRLAQLIGEVLPLTHFLRLARGILLRGAPLGQLRGELGPLALFLVVALGIAILRFRKRLD
jgi:ABC-2 type transport system permease protein